jgi:hypothetical protein
MAGGDFTAAVFAVDGSVNVWPFTITPGLTPGFAFWRLPTERWYFLAISMKVSPLRTVWPAAEAMGAAKVVSSRETARPDDLQSCG